MVKDKQQLRQERALRRAQALTESDHSKQQNRVRNFVDRADKIEAEIATLKQLVHMVQSELITKVDLIYKHIEQLEKQRMMEDQTKLTKRTILEYMKHHNMLQE